MLATVEQIGRTARKYPFLTDIPKPDGTIDGLNSNRAETPEPESEPDDETNQGDERPVVEADVVWFNYGDDGRFRLHANLDAATGMLIENALTEAQGLVPTVRASFSPASSVWVRDTEAMTRAAELRVRFLDQHHNPPNEPTPGILVMPNPWDIGSAKVMAHEGAVALATTSSGMAGSFGRNDQNITRDELLAHVRVMTAAVDVPFNIDAEDCFAADVAGVADTARLLAATDAAGFSIEDYDPRTSSIRDMDVAAARVTAAKDAGGDLVLTARAEQHLYGDADLDDTISRLLAYRDAGADVVYAPGLSSLADIERVVQAVDVPVNVLAIPGTPPIPELARVGVARISVGGLMTWAAYGSITGALDEIFSAGTTDYAATALHGDVRSRIFT